MNRNISRLALAVFGVVVAPTMAQAGSSGKAANASFTVMEQCSIKGSTVSLGAFLVGQTWRQVSAETGRRGLEAAIGTRGTEYLNWGWVILRRIRPAVRCGNYARFDQRFVAPLPWLRC